MVNNINKVDTSAADAKYMWNYFKSQGLNDYGVAGLMGNLYAESALRSCNLQNSYERSLNMTDAEYTVAVDTGEYDNFVHDSAGYGLAQWTYWSLKRDMLDYFTKRNKSIGDLDTQMEFLVHQLSTGYKAVWNTLKIATSVLEASNAVLLKFERPADQSESVQNKRASYGQKYFDLYAAKTPSKEENVAVSIPVGFNVGDVIKLASGAKYTNGKSIPNWVIKSKLYVRQINGDNIVFSILKVGAVTGVVNKKYIVQNGQVDKKTVDEIAKEVIQGKWGNGAERVQRLKAAGYDPNEVQKRVNEML